MKYSVRVTNELFHNKNLEAVKNLIRSYEKAYPGTAVEIFFQEEKVENLDSLFMWGKLTYGADFFFRVDFSGVAPQLSLLKKSLNKASSGDFAEFLSPNFCENLWERKSEKISEEEFRKLIFPMAEGLSSLPLLCKGSVTNFGAATGRIFFSTKTLLEEHVKNQDEKILCIKNATADDVPGIKICSAVIASEGGFSDHSSVLARQFGKPAIIFTDSLPADIKEGDEITVDATESEGKIFLGRGKILLPKREGLIAFCENRAEICKKDGFSVMANCENPRDGKKAADFSSGGIGLFRTEHAFFSLERLPLFQKILFPKNDEEIASSIKGLSDFLKEDFRQIFSIYNGKPVTIRLLDAPLNEFSRESEQNSMLGFRGIRFGIVNSRLYEGQMLGVLQGATDFLRENRKAVVDVRIMLPMVCSASEVDFIINGKAIPGCQFGGLQSFWENHLHQDISSRIRMEFAVMLETPAALEEIHKLTDYVRFFSFGTNDLTQFALGLSRNDSFRFLPFYEKFGIFPKNPFESLNSVVKHMIERAVIKAKSARKDVEFCLCGEQAFDGDTIKFCKSVGIKSLSCSPDKIPLIFYRY